MLNSAKLRSSRLCKKIPDGVPATYLCRTRGFKDATFYKWRSEYCSTEAADLKLLREREDDNRRLNQICADMSDNRPIDS
ncbi:MAG: transposase [Gammaproteobacteria bacterium]